MGRNNADFHNIVYSHAPAGYGEFLVSATHPEHGHVGHMRIGAFHQVRDIMVNEDFRRKGIATGMWNYAKAQGLNPEHSDIRTDEGEKWAKSTGDELPERIEGYA